MKKLLLLLTMFTVGASAMAQNDKAKKAKKDKQEKKYNKRGNGDRNNDGRYDDDRNDNDDNNNNGNNNGNNNAPSKVREAFSRDYPSAQNVTWSKNRGVWTASFRRSGLFGGTRTVSYEANGTRSSNGTRTNNRQRDGRDDD